MVLTTREALKALAEGKKLRATYWPKKCYIYLNSEGDIVDNDDYVEDFNSKIQYVFWNEPVEQKERYYLFREANSLAWYQTDSTYSTDEEFKTDMPHAVEWIALKGEKNENRI